MKLSQNINYLSINIIIIFKGTHSSEEGTLKLRQWNYIAVVYNYGEGECNVSVLRLQSGRSRGTSLSTLC